MKHEKQELLCLWRNKFYDWIVRLLYEDLYHCKLSLNGLSENETKRKTMGISSVSDNEWQIVCFLIHNSHKIIPTVLYSTDM